METGAVEKARRKADLDAKEAANKEDLLSIHTAHALKYIYKAEQITHAVIVAEISKEKEVPFLKEPMYYFYGMEKGVTNSMKNPELIELFADNVNSFTDFNNTSE